MKIKNLLWRIYTYFPFIATENKVDSMNYLIQAHKNYTELSEEKERLCRENNKANTKSVISDKHHS